MDGDLLFTSYQQHNQVSYFLLNELDGHPPNTVLVSVVIRIKGANESTMPNIKTRSVSEYLDRIIKSDNGQATPTSTTNTHCTISTSVVDSIISTPSITFVVRNTIVGTERVAETAASVLSRPCAETLSSSTLGRAGEPSTAPLRNQSISYRSIFTYVQMGCIVAVMLLVGCIMSGISGIVCYRRGRRYVQPQVQSRIIPQVVHPTLIMANPGCKVDDDEELVPTVKYIVPCVSEQPDLQQQSLVLVRPRRSSREEVDDENRYATMTSRDEHLYERISLHRKHKKAQRNQTSLELTNKWASMSTIADMTIYEDSEMELTEFENANRLSTSELELANGLGLGLASAEKNSIATESAM